MHGISQDSKYLVLYLDYIPGGELFNYLRTIGNLNNDEARFYAAQVTLMFEYLHKKDIIYRDLKPENLLIDKFGYLKLTDFGFAKHVEDKTYTLCGTPEYLAPEILLQKGHSKPVDWWCLGILIYEMLVGIDPFSDDDPMAVYQNILRGKIKFPRNFPKEAKSLVKHLLVADLTKRFGNLMGGVNDIKEHKWFTGFEWDALLKRKKQPPYLPEVADDGDTQQFSQYQNSTEEPKAIPPSEDPFINW